MFEIKKRDITVIIQGVIEQELIVKSIQSVKELLPNSPIIVSTWLGIDRDIILSNLSKEDTIITLNDPGNVSYRSLGNINRQIFGRIEALKKVKTKYVLVIRSDAKLVNLNFIKLFQKFKRHKYTKFHFLKERIVVPSFGPIWKKYVYHINDWFFFGCTDDLITLYDIPLFKTEGYTLKYDTPHSWLCYSFVEKFLNPNLTTNDAVSKRDIKIYKKIILENFICSGFEEFFGVNIEKDFYKKEKIQEKKSIKSLAKHLNYNFECEDYNFLYMKVYKKIVLFLPRLGWFLSFYYKKLKER